MAARSKRRTTHATASIDLRDFTIVGPLLDNSARMFFGASASVCLRHGKPRGPIRLRFSDGDGSAHLRVSVHPISTAMKKTFADLPEATEFGACGVALLTGATQLGLRFGGRSYKSTGFDFFVAPPGTTLADPDDIFGGQWGLEVSGILDGDATTIRDRFKIKRRQVAEAVKIHPVLIAVVEFSEPCAIFELRDSPLSDDSTRAA